MAAWIRAEQAQPELMVLLFPLPVWGTKEVDSQENISQETYLRRHWVRCYGHIQLDNWELHVDGFAEVMLRSAVSIS